MLAVQLDLPCVLGVKDTVTNMLGYHMSLSYVFLQVNRLRFFFFFPLRGPAFLQIFLLELLIQNREQSHLDASHKSSHQKRGMERLMEVIRGAFSHDRRVEILSCTVKHKLKEETIAVCKASKN